jgi:hypothetical protein
MTPDTPQIRTQVDLEAMWRRLMSPLGFTRSSIWLVYVGPDDRPVPRLTEIEDADAPPGAQQAAGLCRVLASVADDLPGGRWAFLRTRPGRGGPDAADRAWASVLLVACRRAGVATDVMHLATDDRLVPLPADDLALPA